MVDSSKTFDAIIVGARVAGSAAAIFLARNGRRILLVDKDSFPSDRLSTHIVLGGGAQVLGTPASTIADSASDAFSWMPR